MDQQSQKLFTVLQAARSLGVHPDVIRKQIRRGVITAMNLAPQDKRPLYLITLEEVERYRREHRGQARGGRRKSLQGVRHGEEGRR